MTQARRKRLFVRSARRGEGKNSIVPSFRLTLQARHSIRAKKARSPRFAQCIILIDQVEYPGIPVLSSVYAW